MTRPVVLLLVVLSGAPALLRAQAPPSAEARAAAVTATAAPAPPGATATAVRPERDRWRGARRGALVGGALGLVVVGAALVVDMRGQAVSYVPFTFLAAPAAAGLTLAGAGVGALVAPRRTSGRVAVGVRGAAAGASGRAVQLAVTARF